MRFLMNILAAAAAVMCAAPACAEVSNELCKVLAGDGVAGDQLGWSVSVSGDTAVVGAHNHATSSGAVYVFVRDGSEWTQQAELIAMDGEEFVWFGWSVSISGDSVIVGTPYETLDDVQTGAAYIFVRSGETWAQQAKLHAIDGTWHDGFGAAVSISGDTAVVGAYGDEDDAIESGSAYVFVRNAGFWTQQAKLLSIDRAYGDLFGWSVANDGDTAVVGANLDDDDGSSSGSAYVFVRNGVAWTQQAKLLPSDGDWGDEFGQSVSVSGDTALIGAYRADDNGGLAGSAYVFTRSGDAWNQQAELLADDGAPVDYFGHSVSISGDVAAIGAIQDDENGQLAGSAYVFARDGEAWTQQSKLMPSDGAEDDRFGHSVSISGGNVIVGAYGDDDNGSNSGSAYMFDLGAAPCTAEIDGDGVVGFGDLLVILAAWGDCPVGDPCPADLDGDGVVGFGDLLIMLAVWGPCE